MKLKVIIKYILGRILSIRYGIGYYEGQTYIGLGTKIVRGKKVRLSKNVIIRPRNIIVCFPQASSLSIGEGCDIGQSSRIGCMGKIVIGKNVLTGPNVFIADYNHEFADINIPVIKQGNRFKPQLNGEPNIEIGEGSWIGINAVIVGNVKIGKHCVIGANSVVNRDIPDYCIAAGSPAKVIKRYNEKKKSWDRVE